MESKGEGKYDDDDDDAKSGSTRDAKSESKDQDEQDDALLRHVFDWYYEDEDLEGGGAHPTLAPHPLASPRSA